MARDTKQTKLGYAFHTVTNVDTRDTLYEIWLNRYAEELLRDQTGQGIVKTLKFVAACREIKNQVYLFKELEAKVAFYISAARYLEIIFNTLYDTPISYHKYEHIAVGLNIKTLNPHLLTLKFENNPVEFELQFRREDFSLLCSIDFIGDHVINLANFLNHGTPTSSRKGEAL